MTKLAGLVSGYTALALIFLIAGCAAYEPGDSRTRLDEVPPGPGLFTGEKGAFYIVGGSSGPEDSEAK